MRVDLVSSEGTSASLVGEYSEIEEPGLIAFSLALRWGDEASEAHHAHVRVELEALKAPDASGETTEIALTHTGARSEDERAEIERAWIDCLGRIPATLDDALERFFGRMERYPRFHSRFGGFWADLSDARSRIEGRRELDLLSEEDAERFRHWVEKGYVVLEQAVPHEPIDRLGNEIEEAWRGNGSELWIEYFRERSRHFARIGQQFRDLPHKVLDLHGSSIAAREIVFSAPIRRFLEQLFERPPMAFQSLLFATGTEQDLHQDTAYVLVRSPLEFVGCWVALEDVAPGSGELQYYEGSHRIDEYLWFGRSRAKPYDYHDDEEFLRWVREEPARLGLPLVKFRARKGDVVIWHADLVHGGSPVTREGSSRNSLVTHFSPVDVDPEWFGATEHSEKLLHAPGCYYCHRIRGDDKA